MGGERSRGSEEMGRMVGEKKGEVDEEGCGKVGEEVVRKDDGM